MSALGDFSVRLVNTADEDVALPDFSGLEVSPTKSTPGSIKLDYPKIGKNADQLSGGVEIRVLAGGVEYPGCRFILEDDDGDDVSDDEEGSSVSWTGRTYDGLLDTALVFPEGFATGEFYSAPQDPSVDFTDATAGEIIAALAGTAQSRGCLPDMDFSTFTSAHDSAGNAWAQQITKTYSPSMSLTDVIADLVSLGMVEYEMHGRSLRAFDAAHYGVNHTASGASQVALRKGRDLTQSQSQGSVKGLASVMLVAGSAHYVDAVDAGALATYGRREAYYSAGGVDDEGTLRWVAQAQLKMAKNPTREKSHNLILDNPESPMPWLDYAIGDWIWSDVTGTVEAHRIMQFVVSVDQDNIKSGSVVLDSFIEELDTIIQRRLDKIENGSTVPGPVSDPGEDYGTPNPPTGVVLSSNAYVDAQGNTKAQATLDWVEPTHNTDGSGISNLYGYIIRWQYSGQPWHTLGTVLPGNTSASWSPLDPDLNINVQIIAVETNGHSSTAVTVSGVTADDTIGPSQPSAPTVDATSLPLNLRISWNGLAVDGSAMPPDFDRCEIHVSTVSGFTPTGATLKDVFWQPVPNVTDVDAIAGYIHYVKFVAYDTSNNPSPASPQSSGTPRQVADGEMASLSVTKLTAGTLNADVVVGARIKTADSGARVEINAGGIFAYNSGNAQTVKFSAVDGSATLTGPIVTGGSVVGARLATAASGMRVEIDSAHSDQARWYTGDSLEHAPASLQVFAASNSGISLGASGRLAFRSVSGVHYGGLLLTSPDFGTSDSGESAAIFLASTQVNSGGSVTGVPQLALGAPSVLVTASTFSVVTSDSSIGGDLQLPDLIVGSGGAATLVAGHLCKPTSSAKYKSNIRTYKPSRDVLNLRPILYKDKGRGKKHVLGPSPDFVGFLAEDAHEKAPLHTIYAEGEPDHFMYDRVVVDHNVFIAELFRRVERLEEGAKDAGR